LVKTIILTLQASSPTTVIGLRNPKREFPKLKLFALDVYTVAGTNSFGPHKPAASPNDLTQKPMEVSHVGAGQGSMKSPSQHAKVKSGPQPTQSPLGLR
jgi:hypothetical protein